MVECADIGLVLATVKDTQKLLQFREAIKNHQTKAAPRQTRVQVQST